MLAVNGHVYWLGFMPAGVGAGEYLLLFLVVLIVYGPRRLPDIARSIGRIRERLQRASDAFRAQIMQLEQAAGQAVGADPHESGQRTSSPTVATNEPRPPDDPPDDVSPGGNAPTESV